MERKSSPEPQSQEAIKALLAQTPVVTSACELDLLVFLYRHPRTLLTNERLAILVGYDMTEIARAIEGFIEAGIVERTQDSMHAARMYLLQLEGPQVGGLRALIALASTREGRRGILQVLVPGQSTRPVDALQRKRRLRAIA
jgi:DNA-binding MarR family transcriptional regulator